MQSKTFVMRYLDPKNDLTFKKVFGQHPHLCRSLLNALLPLPEGTHIEQLEYLPAELVPAVPLMKNSIVDVRCVDNFGRQFIVEMQMFWTDSFKQRVLFNASKAYVKQLDKGQEYNLLQPVYALSLVDDVFDDDKNIFYHHYQIVNIDNPKKQLVGLEFVFVELPKFKAESISEKKLQVLWLRYLTEIKDGSSEVDKELMENVEIREAIECLQESAFNKGEMEYYDRYWDHVRIERTLMVDMEEMGLKKGLVKGREEGIKEGAYLERRKIASNAIKSGIKDEIVCQLTGFTMEEIDRIKKENV